MAIFNWLEKYNINVDQIDVQHKKLVRLLNELASAMSNGEGKTVLEDILTQLIDYTTVHFKDEESYFDKIDYPQADKHRNEHKDLMEQVMQFKDNYDSGKAGLTIELMLFLKEWLIKHICDTDKEFGNALNRAGIT